MNLLKEKIEQQEEGFEDWKFLPMYLLCSVGLGNLWMLPEFVVQYGVAFLLVYGVFLLVLGKKLLRSELFLGLRYPTGVGNALNDGRFSDAQKKIFFYGSLLISFACAVVCAVVASWMLKYFYHSAAGILGTLSTADSFRYYFDATLMSNQIYQGLTAVLLGLVLWYRPQQKLSYKVSYCVAWISLIFVVILAAYVSLRFIFSDKQSYLTNYFHLESLLNPFTWLAALGQALFSLCLVGGCGLGFGSRLADVDMVAKRAKTCTLAVAGSGVVSLCLLLPLFAETGTGGLLFVHLPYALRGLPFTSAVLVCFFAILVVASMTALHLLLKEPLRVFQIYLPRFPAVLLLCGLVLVGGLLLSDVWFWLNLIVAILCPVGGLVLAISFAFLSKSETEKTS